MSACTRISIVSLALLTLGAAAPTAQILKISASRKLIAVGGVPASDWHANETACLERDSSNRACGVVIRVLAKGIIFSVGSAKHDLQVGDNVTLRRGSRGVASGRDNETRADLSGSRGGEYLKNNLSLGINLIQPTVGFERALGTHIVLGVMAAMLNFTSGDGKLSGYGGMATLSFYSQRPYKGFWAMLGGGYYTFTASLDTLSEAGSSLTAVGVLGYRWMLGSNLNLALGGGGQYFATSQTATLSFSGILPVATLQLGYAF